MFANSLAQIFASGPAGCSLGFIRCRKLLILARVKFTFAYFSRFSSKREFWLKGNLKAKTEKKPEREFKSKTGKSGEREFRHKAKREKSPKGNLKAYKPKKPLRIQGLYTF